MREFARIHGLAGAGDGLKVEFVSSNLDQHERAVPIITGDRQAFAMEIVVLELPRTPLNEVINVVLGLDPFIGVFMSGKDCIDSVLLQERRELVSQIEIRPMRLAIVVKRMMKVADFPARILCPAGKFT